jgi:hypothetical protein
MGKGKERFFRTSVNIQYVFVCPSFFSKFFSFGMPPHRADRDIIDLVEFQMEMREFTPHQDE